jgi:hypothetical protein
MLGDQLAVQSFVTVMLQAAFSPDGLQFATGDTLDVQACKPVSGYPLVPSDGPYDFLMTAIGGSDIRKEMFRAVGVLIWPQPKIVARPGGTPVELGAC